MSTIIDPTASDLVDPNVFASEIKRRVTQTNSLTHLLPLVFNWKGDPVQLDQHYPFEPVFDLIPPRKMILKCGRQVGKSFQSALLVTLKCMVHPYFQILFTTPLFEQVRRFSTLYLSQLISESPSKRILTGKGSTNQVLQRTLGNQSTIFLGYAGRTADRIRGTSANQVFYDEFQLFNEELIPVIKNVMGGSKYGEYQVYSGTPLSRGNIMERYWKDSSMSEWMIPCRACNYENIAAAEFDLFGMIGPYHSDIGRDCPGTICKKCRRPIFTQDGMWWSRHPDKWFEFRGLHLPQVIMPWHATDPSRWAEFHATLNRGNTAEIYNEVCAESCDVGFRPITYEQLMAACCLPHNNTLREALEQRQKYVRCVMGIDWGGGGMSRESRTKAAIIAMTPTGQTDVIYGIDMNATFDPIKEAKVLVQLAKAFNCEIVSHDASGGLGNVSENVLVNVGHLDPNLIWPMTYVGGSTSGAYLKAHRDADMGRTYYTLDRSRTIQFMCECIKQGKLRFFQYDFKGPDQPGVVQDFMAVKAVIARTGIGRDVLQYEREEGMSDDFLHAVNFGIMGLWARYDAYPRIDYKQYNSIQEIAEWVTSGGERYSVEDIERAIKDVTIRPLVEFDSFG
jgi:hypothetical protein